MTVENDGTLTTDYNWSQGRPDVAGGIICQNGSYVFDQYQPLYIEDIKSLLEAPTSIKRLEFCIGGWGNGSYGNIVKLIRQEGCDSNSILYKNFKALKEVLPEVVAINNDQEQDYELKEVIAFHKMLYEIGYKTTIAPYTMKSYWQSLVANLNNDHEICDRVYLQTYGGGAYNDPNDWKVFGDIPMYVGFDNESNSSVKKMFERFINWRNTADVQGGFVWNFNNDKYDLKEWASAVNSVFPDSEDNGSVGVNVADLDEKAVIYDINGKRIMEAGSMEEGIESILKSSLAKGIYIVKGREVRKVIK